MRAPLAFIACLLLGMAVFGISPAMAEVSTSAVDAPAAALSVPAEDAGHAGESHGSSGLPQLNIATYPGQIFWLIATFAFLYVVFSTMALPAIGGTIAARKDKIDLDLSSAKALTAEAEATKESYEARLRDALKSVQDSITVAENDMKREAAEQDRTLRQKSDIAMKAAEARLDQEKRRAMDDMNTIAAEIASLAAEKIAGLGPDMQKARSIVDELSGKAKAA